ncbi:MAG TPA: hypothetical protein VJT67_01320, partial [Longimicrobiaceae bacterium]|nr:hypothetical protein [Longimicrobiaceae bacterium]
YDLQWIALTERFANAAVRARVNADLEREARQRLCRPGDGPVEQLSSEFEMRVTHLDARLLAVATGQFVSCGGLSPNHMPTALLFDLRTGRRIDVEREMANPTAFRRYVARRAAANAPMDHKECADGYTAEALFGQGFIYLLEERRLTAVPDYAQVALACGFDTEIPRADLARFLKPNSPLRLLTRR